MSSTMSEMILQYCINTLGNNTSLTREGVGGTGGTAMSVLERQRAAIIKLQQEQQLHPIFQQHPQPQPQSMHQQNCYLPQLNIFSSPQERGFQGLTVGGEVGRFNMDPAGMGNNNNNNNNNVWEDFGGGDFSTPRSGVTTTESSGLESAAVTGAVNYVNSRTAPAVGAAGKDITAAEKLTSFKKRKAEKAINIAANKHNDTEDIGDDSKGSNKKIKAFPQDEESSKINTAQTNKNIKSSGSDQSNNNINKTKNNKSDKEASGCTSKLDNTKPDYIHVRARRGQATDSHSLAERVRREKISERMKYLQDLVPGCNKITGKAGMLDEIINYVQSLQRQVEFLSMKLAAVNPSLDFDIDDWLAKEVLPVGCSANLATMGMGPEMVNNQAAYLEYNLHHQLQQLGPVFCGSNIGVNSIDMGLLRRTTAASPASAPETFLDASHFTQQVQNSLPWEPDLQNLFSMELLQQGASGRPTSLYPLQTFTGPTDPHNNIKMEM